MPLTADKIREAAPDIAERERRLAMLKAKREALQEEIAAALAEITSGRA